MTDRATDAFGRVFFYIGAACLLIIGLAGLAATIKLLMWVVGL